VSVVALLEPAEITGLCATRLQLLLPEKAKKTTGAELRSSASRPHSSTARRHGQTAGPCTLYPAASARDSALSQPFDVLEIIWKMAFEGPFGAASLEQFDITRFDFSRSFLFETLAPTLLAAVRVTREQDWPNDAPEKLAANAKLRQLLPRLAQYAQYVKLVEVHCRSDNDDLRTIRFAMELFPVASLSLTSHGPFWSQLVDALQDFPAPRLVKLHLDNMNVGEVVGMDRDVAGVTELTIAWCQWDTWQDAEALVRSFAGLRKFSLRKCDPIRCAPIDYLFELLPQGLDALEFDTTCLEDECISTLLPQLVRFTQLSSLKVWRAFCQDWAFGPALQHLPPSIAELSVELVSLLPIRRRWRVVLTETPYQAVSALLADVEWLPKLHSFSLGSLPAEDEQETVLSDLCSKRGIRYGRLEKEPFDPDGKCGVPPATQGSDCLARLRSLAAVSFLSRSLIFRLFKPHPVI
jgi:hypothetical protein